MILADFFLWLFLSVFLLVNLTWCPINGSCPNFPWNDIRLPTTIIPDVYNLTIYPNLNDFTFSGNVKIHGNISTGTNLIILHQKQISVTVNGVQIQKKQGGGSTVTDLQITRVQTCSKLQQISIELDSSLAVGHGVILDLDFQGQIHKDFVGLYKTDYEMKDGTILSTVVTHFEPSDARKMFPCFDEPQLKATFQVSIIREEKYQALANMPLKYTELYDKNNVGQFANISTVTKSGIRVSIYANSEQIEFGDFGLEAAKKALEFYEKYFNIAYPLPKQDLLSVTDFAMGAMENWGLITFRDTSLLVDVKRAKLSQVEWVAEVICHELGHQWFGNLVTMKWWDDLWLNEGFATLMEHYATDKVKPEWQFMDQFYIYVISHALRADRNHSEITSIEDPDDIGSVFDEISYEKGAAIINMFMNMAGEEQFRKGLHVYLTTYQYSNAEGNDLWQILGETVDNFRGYDFPKIANSWITQPGYPLITDDPYVSFANHSAWNIVFNRFKQSSDPSQQLEYLNVLSSSSSPWILTRYLNMLLDGEIKPSLCTTVFSGTAANPVSKLITWHFLRMNWDKINTMTAGTPLLGHVIQYTVRDFSTNFDYEEVKTFFADKDLGENQRKLDIALESILINIQQKNLNQESLKQWLTDWKKKQRNL